MKVLQLCPAKPSASPEATLLYDKLNRNSKKLPVNPFFEIGNPVAADNIFIPVFLIFQC